MDDMLSVIDTFVDKRLSKSVDGLVPLSTTTPNVLEHFYNNLEQLGYNLTELKPALETQGTSLILSCAGSGKTTYLILKLIRDSLAGELMQTVIVPSADGGRALPMSAKVLVATFLKTGAEELKSAFTSWCKKLNVTGLSHDNFTFCTLHSEYYSVLKDMGATLNILDEKTCNEALRSVVKSLGVHSRSGNSWREPNVEELSDIGCIITYARNRLDDSKYQHPLMYEYDLNKGKLDAMLDLYRKVRESYGGQDFEDLQEIIYNGIQQNPQGVVPFLQKRYKFFYIDEFQDTAQMQYQILKAYFSSATKVCAIGDDDQTIYSWRGSDINIICEEFEKDWQPTIQNLTINYRCKQNILAPIVQSIERNAKRHPKSLKSYAKGGTVTVKYDRGVQELIDGVQSDLGKGYNVGILARTNFDLLMPAILLELSGTIQFSLSRAVGITSAIPKQIFGLIHLVTRRYTPEFEFVLKNLAGRTAYREASLLCQILENQSHLSLWTIPEEDLRYSCPTLATIIMGMRNAGEIDKKQAYIFLLRHMNSAIYKADSSFCVRARTFTSFVADLVLKSRLTSHLTIEQMDELLTNALPKALTARAVKGAKASVRLTTVHEAKGKEWQSVVIWNDVDDSFPAVVGGRRLSSDEFEEERRLHYIAWTRAREKLTVYSSKVKPSPFLLECDFSQCEEESLDVEETMRVLIKTKALEKPKVTIPSYVAVLSQLYEWMGSTDELSRNLVLDLVNDMGSVSAVANAVVSKLNLAISSREALWETDYPFLLADTQEDMIIRCLVRVMSDNLDI